MSDPLTHLGKNKKELEEKIVARAWTNESFKQELLRDPKMTIEKTIGIKFPQNIEVQVLEETSNQLYFILPMQPDDKFSPDELSEEDLDRVGGGSGEGSYLTANCPP